MIRLVPSIRIDVTGRVGIFYSHKDAWMRQLIEEHFGFRTLRGELKILNDREIPFGSDWEHHIKTSIIPETDVALLLVSPNSLRSEFFMKQELPLLLERRAAGRVQVLPILVRHCDWESDDSLKKIQFFPRDNQALLNDYPRRQLDRILVELVGIVSQMLADCPARLEADQLQPLIAGAKTGMLGESLKLIELDPDDEPDPPSPTPAGASLRQAVIGNGGKTVVLDARNLFGRGKPLAWIPIEIPPTLAPADSGGTATGDYYHSQLLSANDRYVQDLYDSYLALLKALRLHQELRSVHFGGAGLRPWGEGSAPSKSFEGNLINILVTGYGYTSGSTGLPNNTLAGTVTPHERDLLDEGDLAAINLWADEIARLINVIYTSGAIVINGDNMINGEVTDDTGRIDFTGILPGIVRRAARSGEALFKKPVEDRLFKKWILEDDPTGERVFGNERTLLPVWMKTEPIQPEVSL